MSSTNIIVVWPHEIVHMLYFIISDFVYLDILKDSSDDILPLTGNLSDNPTSDNASTNDDEDNATGAITNTSNELSLNAPTGNQHL